MFARSHKRAQSPRNVSFNVATPVVDDQETPPPPHAENTHVDTGRITEIARASISLSKLAPELATLSVEMAEGASQQAKDARLIADEAVAMAVALEEAMDTLKISSERIGGIVDSIKKLADQSKILAINAAIEATKAGKAGNAFGAVAVEVESLASRTSNATADVGEKVGNIEESIQKVVSVTGVQEDIRTHKTQSSEVSSKGAVGLSIRGIGDKVRSIATVAQQHSSSASSVAETGVSVRRLCDRLLMAVGSFRLSAHGRASRLFNQIASSNEICSGKLYEQERFLEERIATLPMFELFYLTDRSGHQVSRNIWADTSIKGSDAVGKDWSGKEWFLEAARSRTGETIVSNIYHSEATNSYCFTVSKTVFNKDGGAIGVLAGDVNFAMMLDDA